MTSFLIKHILKDFRQKIDLWPWPWGRPNSNSSEIFHIYNHGIRLKKCMWLPSRVIALTRFLVKLTSDLNLGVQVTEMWTRPRYLLNTSMASIWEVYVTSFRIYRVHKVLGKTDLWPWPWGPGHPNSNSSEIFSRHTHGVILKSLHDSLLELSR